MNLIVNARDAISAGGHVPITTSNAEASSEAGAAAPANGGPYVVLSVTDTGEGMTAEVRQRLFEPFFTTKAPGRGTGLGLSTVYGIVEQSGGEIYVDSELGKGSTFKLYFPRFVQSDAPQGEVASVNESSPRGAETILVVEDDANLRSLVARVLTGRGYTVHVADTGAAGLAIASDPSVQIDAVITDVVMPGMNGRELVEKLLDVRPAMGCLFMSGYTDDEILRRGVLRGETAFLQKPFTPEQLAQSMRSVLDQMIIHSAA